MKLGSARIFTMSLLLGACGTPAGGSDATGTHRDVILGGEPSGAEDDVVVEVYNAFVPSPCSGVLIAPNVVATALHCVAYHNAVDPFACTSEGKLAPPDFGGGWIGEPYSASDIFVFYGTTVEAEGVPVPVREVFGTGSTTVCKDDIAFLVLVEDTPFLGAPIRVQRPIEAGEKVTVIGYDGSHETPDTLRARRAGVEVLEVGPDDTTSGYGTVAPRAFVVGEGLCPGDEGGPAISEDTGAVVGTFSRLISGNACEPGAANQFTKLAPYRALVQRAFESAGRAPNAEPASPSESSRGSDASCAIAATEPFRSTSCSWLVLAFGVLGIRIARSRDRRAALVAIA
jgi:hypothetical protein